MANDKETRKKSTRSSKSKDDVADTKPKITKAPALFKVFYIAEELISDTTTSLCLETFYHPGRNSQALFITHADKDIMEIIEFTEPRRSWLIGSEVCSNGRIYVSTPIDTNFLALYHLRKHCTSRALELQTIHDEKDASVSRLLNKFVSPESLKCIADVKSVGDMLFYKYNPEKTLTWLALKTKRLAECLKEAQIHCGRGALSQNYKRSEKVSEEIVQDVDYLRYASEIVGGYLPLDLIEELNQYLNIPKEIRITEDKDESKKRKSLTTLKATKNKKQKTENPNDDENKTEVGADEESDNEGAAAKLKNSSLLSDSFDDDMEKSNTSPIAVKATPLKERVMTAKEKALAKSAKGSKSIASFFKK